MPAMTAKLYLANNRDGGYGDPDNPLGYVETAVALAEQDGFGYDAFRDDELYAWIRRAEAQLAKDKTFNDSGAGGAESKALYEQQKASQDAKVVAMLAVIGGRGVAPPGYADLSTAELVALIAQLQAIVASRADGAGPAK